MLGAAFAGPGAVAVDNDSYSVHSPVDVTDAFEMPVLLAGLGPTMLRIAGAHTGGTILWMADERAIGDYVVPRITEVANTAGRSGIRVVAGVPVALCSKGEADDARAYATEVLGHADFSPNYVRLLETAMPKTSGTPWPQVTSRPSWRGCAATVTRRVSPISPSGWYR